MSRDEPVTTERPYRAFRYLLLEVLAGLAASHPLAPMPWCFDDPPVRPPTDPRCEQERG